MPLLHPFACERTLLFVRGQALPDCNNAAVTTQISAEGGGFSMACCVRRRALADYGAVSSSLYKGGVLGFACIWVSISCFPPCLCGVSLCPCLLVSAWVGLTYFWLLHPPLHTCNSVEAMNWLTCTCNVLALWLLKIHFWIFACLIFCPLFLFTIVPWSAQSCVPSLSHLQPCVSGPCYLQPCLPAPCLP